MAGQLLRVAMWSGPRNVSTALMRSFGNRSDTFVCDEPLYAHYLAQSGLDHPGRDQTLAHHEQDWHKVAQWLTTYLPESASVFYQKQMAHHLLDHIERDWLAELTHCFLIRHPCEMIPSLSKLLSEFGTHQTGLPQQVELFDAQAQRLGQPPPVIDTKDLLTAPAEMLYLLCQRLGLQFEENMLSWPAGYRDTDGAWAPFWYREVVRTTCFQPYRPKTEPVPPHLQKTYEDCLPLYEKLYNHRLQLANS